MIGRQQNVYRDNTMVYLLMLVLAIVLLPLVVWGLQLLWNALMPELFGLPRLGYWQACGLLVLTRLLVGQTHPAQQRQQ